MKILTIPDENKIDFGTYGPACEGFIDSIKSMFKKKGPLENSVKDLKDGKGYSFIIRQLETVLKDTYDNQEWINNNLPPEAGNIHVKTLEYANVDGVAVRTPKEILKAAQGMLALAKSIFKDELPFIELRQKLIKDINLKANPKYADQIWLAHASELTPYASDRFSKKYKKHTPSLANSPAKTGEWPHSDKKAWCKGFSNTFPSFETDGNFNAPTQKNAKEFSDTIRALVQLLLESNKLEGESSIDYWEFLDVEYDDLKYGDMIFGRITSTDSVYEVSDIFSGMDYVFTALIAGLYIAMFDKHPVK